MVSLTGRWKYTFLRKGRVLQFPYDRSLLRKNLRATDSGGDAERTELLSLVNAQDRDPDGIAHMGLEM